jgi:hypothetical protein
MDDIYYLGHADIFSSCARARAHARARADTCKRKSYTCQKNQ